MRAFKDATFIQNATFKTPKRCVITSKRNNDFTLSLVLGFAVPANNSVKFFEVIILQKGII